MSNLYVPRAARVDLSLPLTFIAEGARQTGHCLNISGSGLLANFAHPPELWTVGELSITAAGINFIVPARVARVVGSEAGLAFAFANDAQREAAQQLVVLAAARTYASNAHPPF